LYADIFAEIGIDEQERLYLRPARMDISALVPEIVDAKAQGWSLSLTPYTSWVNIPDELKT
jgi:hypothetical protein